MGTVREIDGRFMIDFRVARTGKRFRERVEARTKSEARQILIRRESEENANAGAISKRRSGSATVAECFTSWRSTVTPNDAKRVERFVDAVDGERLIDSIDVFEVQGFRDLRLRSVRGTTVRRELSAVSAFFSWAIGENHLSRNPCRDCQRPREKSRSPEALSIAERDAVLLAVADHPLLSQFFMIAMHTALRREEATRLDWSQVDLSVRWGRDGCHRGIINRPGTKTKRSGDPIPVLPDLLPWLESRARRSGPVIVGRHGEAVHPNAINSAIARWNRSNSVKLPNPHQCRHTCITLMLRRGVSLHAVSRFARHASARVTSEIYDHTSAVDFGDAFVE